MKEMSYENYIKICKRACEQAAESKNYSPCEEHGKAMSVQSHRLGEPFRITIMKRTEKTSESIHILVKQDRLLDVIEALAGNYSIEIE